MVCFSQRWRVGLAADSAIPRKKRNEVRESLAQEEREVFDQLLEEYKFHSLLLCGQAFVSYSILGELVKDGWRPSERKND